MVAGSLIAANVAHGLEATELVSDRGQGTQGPPCHQSGAWTAGNPLFNLGADRVKNLLLARGQRRTGAVATSFLRSGTPAFVFRSGARMVLHTFSGGVLKFFGSAEMGLISSGWRNLSVPERYRSDTQATSMRLRPINSASSTRI